MANITYTTEEINLQFFHLEDSSAIINTLVDAGTHSDEIDDNVRRNTEHVDVMLKQEHIMSAGRDLSSFESVVEKGFAFLA